MALEIRKGPSASGLRSSSPLDLKLHLHEKRGVAYTRAATEVLYGGAAAAVRPTFDEHVEQGIPLTSF
jgi:hypothetical protein